MTDAYAEIRAKLANLPAETHQEARKLLADYDSRNAIRFELDMLRLWRHGPQQTVYGGVPVYNNPTGSLAQVLIAMTCDDKAIQDQFAELLSAVDAYTTDKEFAAARDCIETIIYDARYRRGSDEKHHQ